MQKLVRPLLLGLVLLSPFSARAATWDIDAGHSEVSFSVRHLMISNVKGSFDKFTGTVVSDDKDITKSTINVDIDTASVDTRDAKRDEHLKSADFFDAAKNPKISFKSTKLEKDAKGAITLTGDLTMHGITKPVTLAVEGPAPEIKDPWGNTKTGLHASGKLNRKDFGLTWNKALETGGVAVGEEITLNIDVELTKKVPAAAAPAAAPAAPAAPAKK